VVGFGLELAGRPADLVLVTTTETEAIFPAAVPAVPQELSVRVLAPLVVLVSAFTLSGCGSSEYARPAPVADAQSSISSTTTSASATTSATATSSTTTAAVAAGAGVGYGSGADEAVARRAVRAAVPTTPRRTTTAQRAASAPKSATTTKTTAKKAASKDSEDSGGGNGVGTVHPGAFCSHAGTPGVSSTGKAMVCRPGSDNRLRWGKG
jgi:hypothetical protein